MNNNQIFNTGDPVNDKDVVNKIFISRNIVAINLYGIFDNNKFLTSDNVRVRFYGRMYIQTIRIKTSQTYVNVNDRLTILTGFNNQNYNFTHHSDGSNIGPETDIAINSEFSRIDAFQLQKATNIPCVIVYKSLTV